uniref:Alanyl-transfer RNA synthetases family profile domain-containing protein n=1 Tax=Arcella intermedia TaxID=1963864 RepID=A0A6B2L4T1_9EUKA
MRELTATVLSCAPSSEPRSEGDAPGGPLYDVVLDDTVIFPEGGGQPDDYGTVEGAPVVRCVRRDGAAVHVVPQAFEVGRRVLVKLDWARRFDHMQQHTAQHLITAIANKHYQWPTLSWSLGIDKSAIELKATTISPEQLSQLEDLVNTEIMEQKEVKVTIYDQNDPQLKEAKTRGLPEDMKGHVRVVSIGDLDKNMCCGTHVPNLSHLSMIKLLYTEKFKGNTRLYFVAGERARKFLGLCNDVQRKITAIIGRPLKEHVESIGDLQKTISSSAKIQKVLLADLAEQIGNNLKSQLGPTTKSLVYHYTHGTSDFMNTILSLLSTPTPSPSTAPQPKGAPKGKGAKKGEAACYPCLVMLTVGDEAGKEGGNLKLVGPDPLLIQQLQPQLTELLDIKGKLVDGVLQGKINNLKNLKEAQKLVLQLNQ